MDFFVDAIHESDLKEDYFKTVHLLLVWGLLNPVECCLSKEEEEGLCIKSHIIVNMTIRNIAHKETF